ncbi:MAG TPA: HDIG domain-containing protein [Sporosarcina sp.]|nr:HDIG domain-containing protein [Sporosarcina sp.]
MLKFIERTVKPLKFTYFAFFVIIISSIILFFLMAGNVRQETYELKEFQIAPEAIRSLKTVEDTVKTEEERDRAANEVTPVYQFSDDIAKNRQTIAQNIFDHVITAKKDLEKNNKKVTDDIVNQVAEKLEPLKQEEKSLDIDKETIKLLLREKAATLEDTQNEVVKTLQKELSKPLRTTDLTFAKYEIERQLRLASDIPERIEEPVISIARALAVETEILNEQLTESRKEEARAQVEPIRILQGQVLVREGQVIDSEIYRQLELAGLLQNQTAVKPLIAIGLFIVSIMLFMYLAFSKWREDALLKKKSLSIAMVAYLLAIILMQLVSIIESEFELLIAFLFPTAFVAMIIRLLINERIALTMSIITSATAGIILQDGIASIIQMELVLYILFGSMTSIYLLGETARRSSIMKASLGVVLSNIVFISFYLLMTQSSYTWKELIFYGVAAIVSGVLSSSMTIGLLPFFESTFGILSDMKLIELSNPNHPLLKKILIEAPGTYHHSVMVANLADTACESIGANGLLARVGAYYHDIGKTVRPAYFIENQHGEKNPHDTLPPERSRDIIIAHAEDGAQLLEKHKMPSEIVDIARQHHGTSLLKFFLFKAKEEGQEVEEAAYRYAGPKPQTKEIAIISIADSVEAAVRSMKDPTTEKISQLVQAIVSDKLQDGQFDECDLSMKELTVIQKTICETLNGIFHSRIEYPDEEER